MERLAWNYPFMKATNQRSKQSVSELKRLYEVRDEAASEELIRRQQKPVYNRPKFMQANKLSPAEIGTAMHTVMQHVSFENKPTIASVEVLLDNLVHKEILTEEQKEVINIENVIGLFNTEIGERLLNAQDVQREIPFSMAVPVQELNETDESNETILVQGVIDCVFRDDKGIVLLDYKTDGIHDRYQGGFEEARPVLEKRYKVQIQLYTRALEQIWKESVKEKYLYFFDGAHILSL
jgi:ATP-dependent helicase/nuclease subunit A